MIHYGSDSFCVFAESRERQHHLTHKIGLLRQRDGTAKLRFDGKTQDSQLAVSQQLPIILFHPES